MNKLLLTLTLPALAGAGFDASAAVPQRPDLDQYMSDMMDRVADTQRSWRKGLSEQTKNTQLRIVTKGDKNVGPMSYWGSLYTPEGEEWIYSALYHETPINDYMSSISSADITIYDADFNEYKTFTADFDLGDNEVTINSVQVSPQLTRKFFNLNDAYEVMVFVHATTKDYAGHIYTKVYSLSDGKMVTELDGYSIAEINTATDTWSEQYTMAFMRESFDENYDYGLSFDIYTRAGWGGSCNLAHTFDIDYSLVAGAGNYAQPLLINNCGKDLYYALPRYEKPYFVDSMSDDVTPDNNFVIDLYDNSFNLVKTTKIPMAIEGDALFSFPGMGELNGFRDLSFGVYGPANEPMYVVGIENYIASVDEFSTSMYVYDADGNRVKTLFENADDYLELSDVDGFEPQYCIYKADDEGGYFEFVDIISGTLATTIPIALLDSGITTSIDRIAVRNGYQYMTSMSTGIADEEDNIYHRLVWFNADGTVDRFDIINMGKDVVMAQVYTSAEALSPYLYNTDDHYEYMFLVKVRNQETYKAYEYFRVYNDNSELLLEMGPDDTTGEYLNSIFLQNPQSSKSKVVVGYYNGEVYNMQTISLPFSRFAGGSGTYTDPYIIACAGDMHAISTAPNAYYELGCDIDFNGQPWKGNDCEFNGQLNGMGNTLLNLNLSGAGIFKSLGSKAVVTDLNIDGVKMSATGNSGIIAGEVNGGDNTHAAISNININNVEVSSLDETTFGCVVGLINLFSTIRDCKVTNVKIDLGTESVAGGIAGRISTFCEVSNCAVDGKISADVAGGIAGDSFNGNEKVYNCHSQADVTGVAIAGGIIGESARTTVNNCFVDGSVSATGSRIAYAGGIVGSLRPTYDDVTAMVIENNIVAAAISVNENANEHIAHRIAGFTSIDEWLVDWDSKDPGVNWEDPSTYPKVRGSRETAMASNYATCPIISDDKLLDDERSTEGLTIKVTDLTDQFLAEHKWVLGNSSSEPWKRGGTALVLYFEDKTSSSITVVANPATNLVYNGEAVVKADSAIAVYNLAGAKIASGYGSVDVTSLAPGVYVAVSGADVLKFAK